MADDRRRSHPPEEDPVDALIARARQLANTFEGAPGYGSGWSLLFPAVRFAEDRQSRVLALAKACRDKPSALLRAHDRLRDEYPHDDTTAFKAQKLLLDAFLVASEQRERRAETMIMGHDGNGSESSRQSRVPGSLSWRPEPRWSRRLALTIEWGKCRTGRVKRP